MAPSVYPTPQKMTVGETPVDLAGRWRLVVPHELKERAGDCLSGLPAGPADKRLSVTVSADVSRPGGYRLAVTTGGVEIEGADLEGCRCGLATFRQLIGQPLAEVVIEDWADVPIRGIVEGYYGLPWSTADRVALMEWGSAFKMNGYMYAPKDDPKHNEQWRSPYTDEELASTIAPLVDAERRTGVAFIYALHALMHAPVRFDHHYEADVEVLTAKFTQVLDAGCRHLCLLADDADDVGPESYIRILTDLSSWIATKAAEVDEEAGPRYPGLDPHLIFCPPNYFGSGEDWYRHLPETIHVINTGGAVWGSVTPQAVSQFHSVSGRPPFFWLNWPCSDNDEDHVHMGSGAHAMQAGPGELAGLLSNPMQQADPSKLGVFLASCFGWNLASDVDQLWPAAFPFIDHNDPRPTNRSDALMSACEHLRSLYGGRRLWDEGESASLRSLVTGPPHEHLAELEQYFADLAADVQEASAVIEGMEGWMAELADHAHAGQLLCQGEVDQARHLLESEHLIPTLKGPVRARAGRVVLEPLVRDLLTWRESPAGCVDRENC